jgi:hypothetical protein
MNDLNDEQLDLLLREHLSAELDPQLGRAPASFEARSRRRFSRWRAASWSIGAGLALAAAIAGLFLLAPLWKVMKTTEPQISPTPPVAQLEPVEHEVAWNTIDQGTVFVNDNVPMRSIRRERLDRFKWTDPETKAQMQMSVPHDEVVLVGLNAN